MYYICFIIAGYFIGSILFAPIFGNILAGKDIVCGSKDKNPGTANVFIYGGFLCGALTLLCDMAKGFLLVFLCQKYTNDYKNMMLAFVMAAPVLGHTFSIYNNFHGGKGIATTFGSLLGMAPNMEPVFTLAFFFVLFSTVIRITPHFYRTIITYLSVAIVLIFGKESLAIKAGFFLITSIVCARMHVSSEKREKCKVGLLWIH